MNAVKHAALGAAVAVTPDAALVLFGWRRRWLGETHPLVRAHRYLHSPEALPLIALLAYSSHLIADRYSPHRVAP